LSNFIVFFYIISYKTPIYAAVHIIKLHIHTFI